MDRVTLARRSEALRVVLRQYRIEKGFSQEYVAELLGEPQSFVSKYESGVRRLDVVELEEIAGALDISLSELLARYEEASA